jgi:hypothetical protein
MALASQYVQVYGQFPQFFEAIAAGQAPERFTVQHLKDIGFNSTNHRALIPMLKELGFLSADGAPTTRYHDYRNHALSKGVMGEALKEAYSDLFVIRTNPKEEDRALIEGKFKSTHNATERAAKLMTNTFFALLDLADLKVPGAGTIINTPPTETKGVVPSSEDAVPKPNGGQPTPQLTSPSLHYDIQIHLPATKDVEVFNAIFKSLKENLLG